ncbi:Hypothetical predicted protein [Podarcis lilfordi]|uniref:Uncharacterized protein n=1 Tax=Podarcis lilfordi TaxID=74358 RepID=A0AA35NY03_9SAUR|nr:Hypothetical predicted protein [Podarcis lilfordi]
MCCSWEVRPLAFTSSARGQMDCRRTSDLLCAPFPRALQGYSQTRKRRASVGLKQIQRSGAGCARKEVSFLLSGNFAESSIKSPFDRSDLQHH